MFLTRLWISVYSFIDKLKVEIFCVSSTLSDLYFRIYRWTYLLLKEQYIVW